MIVKQKDKNENKAKKKRANRIMDLAVLADHWVKIKETKRETST